MMLILPVHEHGIVFLPFVCVFLNFFTVVLFSEYSLFHLLGKLYSYAVYFSCCYSKWDFFPLISFSDLSLLVYKSAFDFLILTLNPAVLPNLLIRSSSFLVKSVGFLCTLSCHVGTTTALLPPFQFECLLLLFHI